MHHHQYQKPQLNHLVLYLPIPIISYSYIPNQNSSPPYLMLIIHIIPRHVELVLLFFSLERIHSPFAWQTAKRKDQLTGMSISKEIYAFRFQFFNSWIWYCLRAQGHPSSVLHESSGRIYEPIICAAKCRHKSMGVTIKHSVFASCDDDDDDSHEMCAFWFKHSLPFVYCIVLLDPFHFSYLGLRMCDAAYATWRHRSRPFHCCCADHSLTRNGRQNAP